MGAQEWPVRTVAVGTVAVATVRGVEGVRVMLGISGNWDSPSAVGGWRTHPPKEVTDVRPLVVLDPAEYSHLDLARNNLHGALMIDRVLPSVIDDLINAVLEQTRPPKPAEPGPQGLVLDRDGHLWVRSGCTQYTSFEWLNTETCRRADYKYIDVERVESEGIS